MLHHPGYGAYGETQLRYFLFQHDTQLYHLPCPHKGRHYEIKYYFKSNWSPLTGGINLVVFWWNGMYSSARSPYHCEWVAIGIILFVHVSFIDYGIQGCTSSYLYCILLALSSITLLFLFWEGTPFYSLWDYQVSVGGVEFDGRRYFRNVLWWEKCWCVVDL